MGTGRRGWAAWILVVMSAGAGWAAEPARKGAGIGWELGERLAASAQGVVSNRGDFAVMNRRMTEFEQAAIEARVDEHAAVRKFRVAARRFVPLAARWATFTGDTPAGAGATGAYSRIFGHLIQVGNRLDDSAVRSDSPSIRAILGVLSQEKDLSVQFQEAYEAVHGALEGLLLALRDEWPSLLVRQAYADMLGEAVPRKTLDYFENRIRFWGWDEARVRAAVKELPQYTRLRGAEIER